MFQVLWFFYFFSLILSLIYYSFNRSGLFCSTISIFCVLLLKKRKEKSKDSMVVREGIAFGRVSVWSGRTFLRHFIWLGDFGCG